MDCVAVVASYLLRREASVGAYCPLMREEMREKPGEGRRGGGED